MKVLFIGGTGNISRSVSELAVAKGIDLYHLNRGQRPPIPGVTSIQADIHDPEAVRAALGSHRFDAVVNWIAFSVADVERDFALFHGICDQYVFISSASAYQKPPRTPFVTESTPLCNPHWEYSRSKIACEERLMQRYRDDGFPVTIVRPSLTYGTLFPLALGGWGCTTLVDRLKRGLPIVVHGDGTSLWTVTHALDFGAAFLGLLGNPTTLGEAFHITSDEVLTWNGIYNAIADAVGAKANIVHIPTDFIVSLDPAAEGGLWGDKAHSVIFDNSKIKQFVPSWRAEIPFREGARRVWKWFEEDPSRQRIDQGQHAYLDRLIQAYQGGR